MIINVSIVRRINLSLDEPKSRVSQSIDHFTRVNRYSKSQFINDYYEIINRESNCVYLRGGNI